MEHKPPTAVIQAAHGEHSLPLHDTTDFDDADRGFIAALSPCVIKAADGRVVWDNDAYSFLDGAAPTSVHPSLWRQSQLTAKQGLYQVVPGIYQVRGFDISNISFVEGDTGLIVIDPLVSTEVAAAALDLYRAHRGADRPVVAVIYTHSHVDHFGGVLGVTTQADVDAGKVAVLAPEGFTAHAVQENIYAGSAMMRRAGYMYGTVLARGLRGHVGCGLGQTLSTGEVSLVVPTVDITETGETHTIDGVEIEFQMAPGTEAPAEMHFYFPRFRALCMAENATHNLHNLLTLRGALVRDPRAWSGYLTEAIDTFADRTDVVFASHHWPTWGREKIVEFLSQQRDMYSYLHDQTLRLLNQGYTGVEIAEMFQLPPALQRAWHMGMTESQVLLRVEVPNALPLMLGGLRSATLQVVATATVAAYASLGGLGGYLIDGIKERRFHIALVGAMMVAALALTLDGLLALAGWVSVPGTGRMRKLAAVVDKPAAGGGHALR